jgi:hypothetical protein
MPHELAKQLKDAGFPQGLGLEEVMPLAVAAEHAREKNINSALVEKYESSVNELQELYRDDKEYVRNPTLGELIDVIRRFKLVSPNVWEANTLDTFQWTAIQRDKVGDVTRAKGSTPSEALAYLYITLKRKSDRQK